MFTRTLHHVTCTFRILFIFPRQWHCVRFRLEITSSTDLLLLEKFLLYYFISLNIMYVLNCVMSWHPEITLVLNWGGCRENSGLSGIEAGPARCETGD